MTSTAPRARATTAARLTVVWTLLLAVGYAVGRLITDVSWTWDAAAVTALRGTDGTILTGLMRAITTVGSPLVLNIVFVVALAGLLLRRRHRTEVFSRWPAPAACCWNKSSSTRSTGPDRSGLTSPAPTDPAGRRATPAARWRSSARSC